MLELFIADCNPLKLSVSMVSKIFDNITSIYTRDRDQAMVQPYIFNQHYDHTLRNVVLILDWGVGINGQ